MENGKTPPSAYAPRGGENLSVSGANSTIFHFPFSIFHFNQPLTLFCSFQLRFKHKTSLSLRRGEILFSIFNFPFSIEKSHHPSFPSLWRGSFICERSELNNFPLSIFHFPFLMVIFNSSVL